ncbi:MAG: CvpA family protein [Ruminococcaceae bacterium]|nr:CvpA family protein [Oscillospiraceae bacterium]
MNFACDIILIGIACFTLFSAWSKGFIRSFMGLAKGIAAGFAAYAYTPKLGAYLNDRLVLEPLAENIGKTLRSLSLDTKLSVDFGSDIYNLDRLAADLPEPLVSILERYNIDPADFSSAVTGLEQVTEDIVNNFASGIASPTAAILSNALAFAAIFLGVFIALSIITSLLDLIFRMPVLNTANKFFGVLLGAAEAFLLISITSIILNELVCALGSVSPDLFGPDVIEHTVICKFFVELNPIGQIYNVLK